MTLLDALKVRPMQGASLRGRVQAGMAARPLLWGVLAFALLAGFVVWGRLTGAGTAVAGEPPAAALYSAPPLATGTAAAPVALADAGPFSAVWSITALLLVLVALYASLWALRRFATQRAVREGGALLQVSSSVRLGANQTLHVVRFGANHLLVGASQAGLAVLATEPAAVETGGRSPAEGTPFAEVLARAGDLSREG